MKVFRIPRLPHTALALFLLVLLTPGVSPGGQPVRFNYQAKLSDTSGAPLTGSHTVHFKLYSGGSAGAADSGALVYSETAVLDATNGVVNHAVGSGTPVSGTLDEAALAGDSVFFLQVAVDAPSNTVLPRTRLEPVPFAVHALSAANATGGLPAGFLTLTTSAAPPSGFSYTGKTLFTPWVQGQPMPTGRAYFGAAAHDGKVYAIGGSITGSALSAENSRFDPSTSTWTTLAPMPTIRRNIACATVDGYVYAFGGDYDNSIYYATTERYDTALNSWTSRQSLAVARTECATAVVNGKVYIIGGRGDGFPGPESTTVEEYDPVFNNMATKAPMPTGRARCGAAAVNGRIYVVGGWAAQTGATTTTVEEYDPGTNTWTSKAPMPVDRARHGVASVDGRIYVYGGYSEADVVPAVTTYVYDPAADTWASGISMLSGRAYFPGVSDGTRLFAIGGIDATDFVTPSVQYYDPTTYFVHMKN